MRLHLINREKPQKHDVWTTEINVKLRGRKENVLLHKIPKKLLDRMEVKT